MQPSVAPLPDSVEPRYQGWLEQPVVLQRLTHRVGRGVRDDARQSAGERASAQFTHGPAGNDGKGIVMRRHSGLRLTKKAEPGEDAGTNDLLKSSSVAATWTSFVRVDAAEHVGASDRGCVIVVIAIPS